MDLLIWIRSNLETFVLIVSSITMAGLVLYWHTDPETKFDIRDVLVEKETGRASLFKIGQLLALFVSTWALVHETRAGRLSEWLFFGFMIAWSGSNLINKYIKRRPMNENSRTDRISYEEEPYDQPTRGRSRPLYDPPEDL